MDITVQKSPRRSEWFGLDYKSLESYVIYSNNIIVEYQQLFDEGHDVAKYENLAKEIKALPCGKSRDVMADILSGMMHDAPIRAGYSYDEPSELGAIQAARKPCPGTVHSAPDRETMRDKIKGAWLGRLCGCLLGRPFEGMKKPELDALMQATGNYPMRRYALAAEMTDEQRSQLNMPMADMIEAMFSDDDTNYTAMASQIILEKYGRDFTPYDVAAAWVSSQPKSAYATAERVAFANITNGYMPPLSAVYQNAYREWIGAQIRADYYGYINPGDPETAADMAWRDASISHVKNGIYGSMFVAAMLAYAAVCGDLKTIVLRGLAEIPENSRLHAQVLELLSLHASGAGADTCVEWIHARYDETNLHHWCHTVSNALIVVYALLYGNLDFGKTVCLAVSIGFDTDCNGATAGSILGMVLGAGGVPDAWTAPLKGKLETTIFGVGTIAIDSLCDATMRHMPKGEVEALAKP